MICIENPSHKYHGSSETPDKSHCETFGRSNRPPWGRRSFVLQLFLSPSFWGPSLLASEGGAGRRLSKSEARPRRPSGTTPESTSRADPPVNVLAQSGPAYML